MIGGTGRLVNHDPRNRRYEAPRRAARPVSWLHRTDAEAMDQGHTNACTGFAAAQLLNAALAHGARRRHNDWAQRPHASRYLGHNEAVKLYSLATLSDSFGWQYPPTDGGSSGLGVGKALKGIGTITSYQWTFDFANALAWAQRQPVLLGTLWTAPMSEPDEHGVIHVGSTADLRRAESVGMGHEYLWRGCRWDRRLARIRNSWGPTWGIDGDAYIPIDELEELVMEWRGDVMVPEVGTP
ncbi:peptidase [Mycobacterium phage Saguaro]|uniref:Cysteine protease n=1 Tax=Mycobacterium phage Saguaro TaxID=2315616 RepID=A0A386K9Y2_9CAUD|nr:peptidase [Mycobacterium phage Saguaro]AYD82063.1 cysteine protease [Mycobacterium phage Saguaro]